MILMPLHDSLTTLVPVLEQLPISLPTVLLPSELNSLSAAWKQRINRTIHTHSNNLLMYPADKCVHCLRAVVPSASSVARSDDALVTACAAMYTEHCCRDVVILSSCISRVRVLHPACASNVHIASPGEFFAPDSAWKNILTHELGPDLQSLAYSLTVQASSSDATADNAGKLQHEDAGGSVYKEHLSHQGALRGIADGSLYKGKFQADANGGASGTVHTRDIVVHLRDRACVNRALHNDTVVVKLLAADETPAAPAISTEHTIDDGEVENTPATVTSMNVEPSAYASASSDASRAYDGIVLHIMHRADATIVAAISERDENELHEESANRRRPLLAVPVDKHLPLMRLFTKQGHLMLGKRIALRLSHWDANMRHPVGQLTRILGARNDPAVELRSVLLEANVEPKEFSERALQQLPRLDSNGAWRPPESECQQRENIQDILTMSIDPSGATDVDDVLSMRHINESCIEVGVLIADVSWFVTENSALDLEALARGETVYTPSTRFNMLPEALSSNAGSLIEHADRLAFGCFFTIDKQSLEVHSNRFSRVILTSDYQLTYAEAQGIIDNQPQAANQRLTAADRARIYDALSWIHSFAECKRKQRLNQGALEIESVELSFDFANQSFSLKEKVPMMTTVAEMMIQTNAAVGEALQNALPRAGILRTHAPPKASALEELEDLLQSEGLEVDIKNTDEFAFFLDHVCKQIPSREKAALVKTKALRAMREAQYCSVGNNSEGALRHYGLAIERYMHFTSPLRRYADIVAHRQLRYLLSYQSAGHYEALTTAIDPASVAAICDQLNERHRSAKRAQERAQHLYLMQFLSGKETIEGAVVDSIRNNGRNVGVYIPALGMRCTATVDLAACTGTNIDNCDIVLENTTICMTYKSRRTDESLLQLKLLQRVMVRILVVPHRHRGPSLNVNVTRSILEEGACLKHREGPASMPAGKHKSPNALLEQTCEMLTTKACITEASVQGVGLEDAHYDPSEPVLVSEALKAKRKALRQQKIGR